MSTVKTILMKCPPEGSSILPIAIDDQLKGMIDSSEYGMLEIRIEKYSRSISAQQRRYYFGLILPAIVEQVTELGEKITKDEADVINRTHANHGKFRTLNVGNQDTFTFEELRLSGMSKKEFNDFLDNITLYWGERGVQIPIANTNARNTNEPLQRG